MGLECTVCKHPQAQSIDAALASGALSNRSIAKQFDLGAASIDRHVKSNHVGRRIAAAAERKAVKADDQFMDGILSAITAGRRGVDLGLAAADAVDDPATLYRLTPAFMAQQLRALELLGNATGRLKQEGTTVTVNYLAVAMPRPEDTASPAIEATCVDATSTRSDEE